MTESDPGLTDLRLLLQINQALALGGLDRYDEALDAARQARQLASQVGTHDGGCRRAAPWASCCSRPAQWDDALAETSPGRGL